jgi:hypothetical protein
MDNEIKKTLWATADKLRSNMDAAEYKHIVLGADIPQIHIPALIPKSLIETKVDIVEA